MTHEAEQAKGARTKVLSLLLATWSASFCACSDSHRRREPAAGDEKAPGQAQSACAEFAAALCARRWDCIPFAFTHGHGFGDAFGTELRCTERMTLACDTWQRVPGTRTTPAALARCSAELEGLECRTSTHALTKASAGCDFERGSFALGAACELDFQCQSGRCAVGADYRQICIESAQLPDTPGAACQEGRCAEDLVCLQGACVGPALLDETCGEGQPPCAQYAEIHCGELGVCVPPRTSRVSCGFQLDAPEAGSLACESGECVGMGDRGTGYCGVYAADGEPCDYAGPACLYPAECVDKRCVPQPVPKD